LQSDSNLNSNHYSEILIIGGGLAGLVSAVDLLQAGHQVLLIEKKNFPRQKVCGEYVSNEVKPYLQRLGAYPEGLKPKNIKRLQISSDSGSLAECKMEMGGFGISRYTLDHFLFQKATALGAKILTNTTVQSIQFLDDHFEVKVRTGETFRSTVVLGAYGKRSLIDKTLNRDFISQKSAYVGIKHHFEGDFPEDLVALHNFEGGYCGLSQVENGHINLCYLTTTKVFKQYDSIAEFEQRHLTRNPYLKDFFASSHAVFKKPLVISQVSFASKPVVENHVLMCGDAAGLIHPLCGNGMAMAIHSAQIASDLVKQFLEGKISRSKLETTYKQRWLMAFNRRLNFGRMAENLFSSSSLTSAGVRVAHRFPALLQRVVKLSHGPPIV